MLDGSQYINSLNKYFNFLEKDFSFKLCDSIINGNVFYDIQYHNTELKISISMENLDQYLEVVIIPSKTINQGSINLSDTNAINFEEVTEGELQENSDFFKNVEVSNRFERDLLKHAKELRLFLNIYYQKERNSKE